MIRVVVEEERELEITVEMLKVFSDVFGGTPESHVKKFCDDTQYDLLYKMWSEIISL